MVCWTRTWLIAAETAKNAPMAPSARTSTGRNVAAVAEADPGGSASRAAVNWAGQLQAEVFVGEPERQDHAERERVGEDVAHPVAAVAAADDLVARPRDEGDGGVGLVLEGGLHGARHQVERALAQRGVLRVQPEQAAVGQAGDDVADEGELPDDRRQLAAEFARDLVLVGQHVAQPPPVAGVVGDDVDDELVGADEHVADDVAVGVGLAFLDHPVRRDHAERRRRRRRVAGACGRGDEFSRLRRAGAVVGSVRSVDREVLGLGHGAAPQCRSIENAPAAGGWAGVLDRLWWSNAARSR